MESEPSTPQSIDEYIAGFPEPIQEILTRIRATIHLAAPGAEEAMKYRMPAFILAGNLVYFAVFKKHIGFYPGSKAVRLAFEELAAYPGKEGSIQFPLEGPIPYDLIERMVKFRVAENLRRSRKGSRLS